MARLLLLHGLGGTGATVAPLAAALAAHGHQVHTPTLPGHGTEPQALAATGWADWLAAAGETVCDIAIGQSMGGNLALALASSGHCRAVVAINPPPPDPDAIDGLEWQRSRGIDWVDGPPLADGEEGYTSLPVAALLEMVIGTLVTDLAAITQPVLLITSALDDVVDPFSADYLASLLPRPGPARVTLAAQRPCRHPRPRPADAPRQRPSADRPPLRRYVRAARHRAGAR
jgi:carboxylesterase